MHRLRAGLLVTAIAATAALPGASGTAFAQDTDTSEHEQQALRVFLDCEHFCDLDYLRREITFVNYVVDRRDAQLHVLVTAERSGSGARYTFDFIGLEAFEDNDVRHVYSASNTNTGDETRAGIAQVLRVGLLHYVIETPLAQQIAITPFTGGTEQSPIMVQPEDDPWNFWVFRLSANTKASGEASRTQRFVEGEFSANRTTEQWKIRLSTDNEYSDRTDELSSGEFKSVMRENDVEGQVVKSLGEHWGASVSGEVNSSTFVNLDLGLEAMAGVELNVFPYSESSRRILTFAYEAGVASFDYSELTIFDTIAETLPVHNVTSTFGVNQPWGDSSIQLEYTALLNDLSRYGLSVEGELSFRVVRGLDFFVSGSTELVRNQLFLPQVGLSDEEILLQLQDLATDSRYSFSFGLSYTFGSIFNNVVNPRF